VHSQKPQLRDFKHRIIKMSAMYRTGLYARIFGAGKSFRYLTITSGGVDATGKHDRIHSLREAAKLAIAEVSQSDNEISQGYQRYLFARWHEAVKPNVTEYFSTETIFNTKAFMRCDDDERHALIW